MAAIQQTAAGWSPRLDNQNRHAIVTNNGGEVSTVALIVFNCHSSHLLKFLDFDVFCAYCSSTEKIIANYSKVIIVCEGNDQSAQFVLLKAFTKYENVFVFPLSESIIGWYERLKSAGLQMVKEVFASAFNGAKSIQEVTHHER